MPTTCDGLAGLMRPDLVGRLDALAADDQIVLAAELSAHFFDGGAHLAHVLFAAEINKRLSDKRSLVEINARAWRSFEGRHRNNPFGSGRRVVGRACGILHPRLHEKLRAADSTPTLPVLLTIW